MTFEVLLECSSFGPVSKCDGDFDPPRAVVCCTWNLSLIVLSEAAFEISGEASVVAAREINATELIDVVKHGPSS